MSVNDLTTFNAHGFSKGDYIKISGRLMMVTEVKNQTTFTVRKSRWYDYLWFKIVMAWQKKSIF
jgi:hypothetical protein